MMNGDRDECPGCGETVPECTCFQPEEFEEVNTMLPLYKFYADAALRASRHHERKAQAVFNHLCEVRPGLAEIVRGTDRDPYYVTDTDTSDTWKRFVVFIESNWYFAKV